MLIAVMLSLRNCGSATAPMMIRPCGDILGDRREAEEEHDADHQAEQQAAGERAAHGALAAEEADAAEHRGGDRVAA